MDEQINIDKAEHILLVLAVEDYSGLYEAIWDLNGKYPAATLGMKYEVAERAIRSLHSKGLIEFHRMIFSEDYSTHKYEPLEESKLDETLSNPISWYPDYNYIRIVFTSTQKGDQVFFSGGKPAT
jgi:predicted amidohydrolase YtcJ